jgi:tetratricopeptide (TPR) repeat protein
MSGKGKGEKAKEKGNEAFRKGQYAEAVGLYTEAVLADASNHVYYLNRSMAYMKLNKFEDAERDASASLRLGGDNMKAYFRRGTARKHLSNWKDAKGGEI